MGMTVNDKEVYTHRSLKTGSMHSRQGHRKHQGWSGGGREGPAAVIGDFVGRDW